MSDITPWEPGGLSRDSRRAARSISRGRSIAQVRMSQVDAETDVALAKCESLTAATGAAMSGVVRVAQAQRQLEGLSPEASGRLAFLAEAHALAMGDEIQDLRRHLRSK